VQRANVRMVESGDGARLALKSLHVRGVHGFDGHRAAQSRIGRFVDLTHSARADQFQQLVWPEPLPRNQGRHGLQILPNLGEDDRRSEVRSRGERGRHLLRASPPEDRDLLSFDAIYREGIAVKFPGNRYLFARHRCNLRLIGDLVNGSVIGQQHRG